MLSFWRIPLNDAFAFPSSSDFPADHQSITLTNWPLSGLDPSDHQRIVLTFLLFLQSATALYFFIGCSSLPLLTYFSKKRCQQMPPSFRVNNLLLQNVLESIISLDLKSATGSQQIFGVINTVALVLSFFPKSCCSNSSSFQATNPKLQSFC
jgi:hypothetical protein